MEDRACYQAAYRLIDLYGSSAAISLALERLVRMACCGDIDGAEEWNQIIEFINTLCRSTPRAGERVH